MSRAHVLVTCRGEPADRLYSARRVYKLDGCGQKEEIVYQQVYIASDTMYVLEARGKSAKGITGMIETQGKCYMYGENSGALYGHRGEIVGVESCDGKSVLCVACEFRYECGKN